MTPLFRSRSLCTKLTEAEYLRIAQIAADSGRNISEWLREFLLQHINRSTSAAEHKALLAEVLALRAIFLTLFFRTAAGKLTEQDMTDLIRRADEAKDQRAEQRLNQAKQEAQ